MPGLYRGDVDVREGMRFLGTLTNAISSVYCSGKIWVRCARRFCGRSQLKKRYSARARFAKVHTLRAAGMAFLFGRGETYACYV